MSAMKSAKSQLSKVSPKYQYQPLSGDDIRLIKLQPGCFEDDLYAEIIHCPVEKAPARSQSDFLPIAKVDKTLPEGWRSFRTPEGRLLYQDMEGRRTSQWHHPSFASLPERFRDRLLLESRLDEHEAPADGKIWFEALSYAWGDPTPQDSLCIKGILDTEPICQIPVTANLSSALRHLRKRQDVRVIWADAICINQEDLPERNAQVSRIADIFTSASRVVVWLGDSSYDSKLALHTLQYLGGQTEISQQKWIHSAPDGETPHWADRSFQLPYSDFQWSSLDSLFSRPWFSRLWVLQEIGLASSRAIVQCGYDSIPYYNMRRAIVALHLRSGAPQSLLDKMYRLVEMSHGATNLPMVYLLAVAQNHQCSVAHDKVYGLLGFFGPTLRRGIQPSYEAALLDIFKNVFVTHSTCTGSLELLAHCSSSQNSHWPSWVPNWTADGMRPFTRTGTGYQAAGFSRSYFTEANQGELEVTGILCDTVSSMFQALPSEDGDSVHWMRKLFTECKDSLGYALSKEAFVDVFARLLSENELKERFSTVEWCPRLANWKEKIENILSRTSFKLEEKPLVDAFYKIRKRYWARRRTFSTGNARLGSGPVGVENGDLVCIVLGLYCPLVIRQSRQDRYRIIGRCYIPGLMDSEVLLGTLPENVIVQQPSVDGRYRPYFYNTATKVVTIEDPRLGSLDQQWEKIDEDMTADDPLHCDFFRNRETGKVINYDPRMTVEALEQNGVKLQTITLV